ncbi:MAG: hypothetical protein JSU96_05040 [Acidobacteriota bacterium]|nr:MAG: hypothetical protein JSU96_05040 [Acidobacteriota bacterium]
MAKEKDENPNIRYAVDEDPPHLLSAGLGLQVVILILAGIAITPIIVLRAAGVDEYANWLVFAAIFVSGLTTIIQARPIGPFGAAHVLFMGTSGAFIAVAITAVVDGGIPLLATLVLVSALIQFWFASRLHLLRKIINPTVGGTVIMLIAVTVFPIVFGMLDDLPEGYNPESPAALVTAVITFIASVCITLFASGQLRLWGPLFGVVLGCICAAAFGIMDFSRVASASWVGVPDQVFPGLDLSFDLRFWSLLPAFVIVTVVGAIETFGDGIAIQRVSSRKHKPVDFKTVQGAVYADGLGNFLSGLVGTLPNTTYSTSISVVDLTGVGARRIGIYGGGFLMAIAFSPKISALLQAIPNPVVAAYATVLLVLLFGHGLRLVFEGGLSYENGIVVCLAFWLGTGFQNQWIFSDLIPGWAHTILDNGMTAGGMTAVLLTLILALKNRSKGRLTLESAPGSIPKLHEYLSDLANSAGWDRTAVDRLHLAGEEALLFLISRTEQASDGAQSSVRVSGRETEGIIEVEFVSGPGAANLEGLVRDLGDVSKPVEEEAGLRILRHLVKGVRHQQFHQGDYLVLQVDSAPLA